MRRIGKRDAASLQLAHGKRNVRRTEVKHRARRHEWLGVSALDKETHARAIEEQQLTEAVEFAQAERAAVESLGLVDVIDAERYLAELVQCQRHACPFSNAAYALLQRASAAPSIVGSTNTSLAAVAPRRNGDMYCSSTSIGCAAPRLYS